MYLVLEGERVGIITVLVLIQLFFFLSINEKMAISLDKIGVLSIMSSEILFNISCKKKLQYRGSSFLTFVLFSN